MPTRDGYAEGIPSWADLGTQDVEGAKAFYNAVFGWEYQDEDTDSNPYSMALKQELSAAGIGPLQDENMPTVWSTYFAVDDADAAAARITAAGGSLLMEPFDEMDAGRMAFASDPTGAVFGIWEAKNHFGAAIVNEHGALNWNELLTDDLDTALGFYRDVFGHKIETADMGNGFMYSTINVDDRAVGGAMSKPNDEMPNHWGVYFAVDSAADAAETITSNGGTIVYGPSETEGVGIFVGAADPNGAHFSVIQLANPVD